MNKKPTKADAEDALRKALVHLAGVPADSPSAQEQAVKLFYRFRDECKKGSNVPAGVFTHALHSEIDFRIEKAKTRTDLGARVTCTKGCAACCYQRVEITPQEGRVMLRAAKRINFPIDEARVRTQAKLSIEEFNGLAHAIGDVFSSRRRTFAPCMKNAPAHAGNIWSSVTPTFATSKNIPGIKC